MIASERPEVCMVLVACLAQMCPDVLTHGSALRWCCLVQCRRLDTVIFYALTVSAPLLNYRFILNSWMYGVILCRAIFTRIYSLQKC